MEFFNLIKASQKSKKPNGIFWFTAKTEARAKLQASSTLPGVIVTNCRKTGVPGYQKRNRLNP